MKIVTVVFFVLVGVTLYADVIDEALIAHRNGNYQLANQKYTQACNNDNAKGCVGLGSLYALGHGVQRDIQTAQKYFQQACKAGNERGCYNYKTYDSLKDKIK